MIQVNNTKESRKVFDEVCIDDIKRYGLSEKEAVQLCSEINEIRRK